MLIALALQAAAPAEASPRDAFAERAWARVTRAPILTHGSDTIHIATARSPSARTMAYTLRLTRRRFSQPDQILWADSRDCRPIAPMLEAMRSLPSPRPAIPGMDDPPPEIVVDGTSYSLASHARFAGGREANLQISTNIGTPLAAWVDQSLAALERCWSPVEPRGRR